MSITLFIGATLALVGASCTAYLALSSGGGFGVRLFEVYASRLEVHTSFLLGMPSGERVARIQLIAVCTCCVIYFVTEGGPALVLTALAALAPPLFLRAQHARRVDRLERQLDAWLLMLSNALKASPSVGEAIGSTATLIPRPFSEEVDLLVKELRLGVPLGKALEVMARRIASPLVSGALTLILVARQTGGDLPATLERASAALRESARLEGVLRTKTAEGRGQVLVLASVPFVLCVVIAWLDRSWFDPMLHHSHGRAILAGCALAWATAGIWAHHIMRAEL